MKGIFAVLGIAMILFASCKKSECVAVDERCNDTPPTQEMCTAHFERWFYNASTNTCVLVPYSGCSVKGFETEAECNSCKHQSTVNKK